MIRSELNNEATFEERRSVVAVFGMRIMKLQWGMAASAPAYGDGAKRPAMDFVFSKPAKKGGRPPPCDGGGRPLRDIVRRRREVREFRSCVPCRLDCW